MRKYILTVAAVAIVFNSCRKENISALSSAAFSSAENSTAVIFKVARVLGSNMVVQRNKPFTVWGTAVSGSTIAVQASWNTNVFTAVSDSAGNWSVIIPAAAANADPQTLEVKENGIVKSTFTNILIGDVWLCSGQSNMDMPVDSTGPWPFYEGVTNYQQEIADANYPLLRLVKIKTDFKNKPVTDLSYLANWSVCSPATVKAYSAVAYFFGRKLTADLNVPIGLVVSCVGGTSCEAWTQKETIQADPVLNAYYSGKNFSSQLFNGMINPLKNLSLRGFTWYQGENNRHDSPAVNYTNLNAAMIGNWRNTFNQGSLPFYYVQMTPYDENFFNGSKPSDYDYAIFREAQQNVRTIAANSGMAVTMDVGDEVRIHPRNKRPVGERLALLAMNKEYALPVQSSGPVYASFTSQLYKARILFKPGTADGLSTSDGNPVKQYFYAAGTDHIFRKCKAIIHNKTIIITAPAATPLPILAVRYAFTNYPITNLQNSAGLPAEPFRTDDW